MKEERELRSILTEEEGRGKRPPLKKKCWSFLRLAWELQKQRGAGGKLRDILSVGD